MAPLTMAPLTMALLYQVRAERKAVDRLMGGAEAAAARHPAPPPAGGPALVLWHLRKQFGGAGGKLAETEPYLLTLASPSPYLLTPALPLHPNPPSHRQARRA